MCPPANLHHLLTAAAAEADVQVVHLCARTARASGGAIGNSRVALGAARGLRTE